MKSYRLIMVLFLLIVLSGCGSQQSSKKEPARPDSASAPANYSPDEAAIRASITESFDRIKEGDKTVMYENEFQYYRMDTSLSQYLELTGVQGYGADSLMGLEIDSVIIMGDSAKVYGGAKYESADGTIKTLGARIKMYRDVDRWIRPYVSKYAAEKDYLEQKRIYDSVTAGQ